jgi:hypothetical protein
MGFERAALGIGPVQQNQARLDAATIQCADKR